MNSYINRRDGAVSAAAVAAPPLFEDSDERRREREERWLLGDVLLGGRRLCCRASEAGPSGLWPHHGAPKCSPHVSVTVLLTDQLLLLPPPCLPPPSPPGPSSSILELITLPSSLVSSSSVTRERGHFLSNSHPLYFFQWFIFFTCRFKQNV